MRGPEEEMRSMAKKVIGRTTIRSAAVLFVASAVFEIMDYNSAVAFFGGVRIGAAALIYHFIFTVSDLLSGIGLWTAKPWGYWAFMATAAIYTIDKVPLMLFPPGFLRLYCAAAYSDTRDRWNDTQRADSSILHDSVCSPFTLLVGICTVHSHEATIFPREALCLITALFQRLNASLAVVFRPVDLP
jgi:hypothetical protein